MEGEDEGEVEIGVVLGGSEDSAPWREREQEASSARSSEDGMRMSWGVESGGRRRVIL